jgi:predicted PurR-regulated permease PerM
MSTEVKTQAQSENAPAVPKPHGEYKEGKAEESNPAAIPQIHQSRTIRFCIIFITVALLLYGLYVTKAIAFPIVLAVLIALPLRPAMRWLKAFHIPNPASAFLLCTIVLAVVIIGCVMLWQPAQDWFQNSQSNLEEVERKLRSIRQPISEMQNASESVEKLTADSNDPETLQVQIKQPSLTNFIMSTTGTILIGGTITVSLVFLFLAFGEGLMQSIVHSLPSRIDRHKALHMMWEAERTISRYLLSYSLINLGLGVVIGTGMWLIGMPNPVLWGVMAACLNYIPFLGLALGTSIVFLVAVVSFDSIQYALLAPTIYLLANGVEANVITPLLLGRSLKLNVIIIFLFIVIWGWMWGIGGALIAVPLLIVAKVVCDHVERLQPVAKLLGA